MCSSVSRVRAGGPARSCRGPPVIVRRRDKQFHGFLHVASFPVAPRLLPCTQVLIPRSCVRVICTVLLPWSCDCVPRAAPTLVLPSPLYISAHYMPARLPVLVRCWYLLATSSSCSSSRHLVIPGGFVVPTGRFLLRSLLVSSRRHLPPLRSEHSVPIGSPESRYSALMSASFGRPSWSRLYRCSRIILFRFACPAPAALCRAWTRGVLSFSVASSFANSSNTNASAALSFLSGLPFPALTAPATYASLCLVYVSSLLFPASCRRRHTFSF